MRARVDPATTTLLLRAVLQQWNPPVTAAALVAGAAAIRGDIPEPSFHEAAGAATEMLGDDYCRGFADGLRLETRGGRKTLRYVYGLDDASRLRSLLRLLPWGRALLASSSAQPQL